MSEWQWGGRHHEAEQVGMPGGNVSGAASTGQIVVRGYQPCCVNLNLSNGFSTEKAKNKFLRLVICYLSLWAIFYF